MSLIFKRCQNMTYQSYQWDLARLQPCTLTLSSFCNSWLKRFKQPGWEMHHPLQVSTICAKSVTIFLILFGAEKNLDWPLAALSSHLPKNILFVMLVNVNMGFFLIMSFTLTFASWLISSLWFITWFIHSYLLKSTEPSYAQVHTW